MSAARWVVGCSLLALMSAAGARIALRPDTEPADMVRGRVAPYRPEWTRGWAVAGRIPAPRLESPEVVDLAAEGDTLFVLQRHHWFVVTPSGVRGPYGGRVRGAPGWIGRAGAIAVGDAVYVLDAAAQRVQRWDRSGRQLGGSDLSAPGSGRILIPERVAADAAGRVWVTTRSLEPDGSSRWLVLRFGPGAMGADTVYAAPMEDAGGGFSIPWVSVRRDGAAVLVEGGGYTIHRFAPDGRPVGTQARADPPLRRIDDRTRARYARVLDRLPPDQRRLYALPEHFPPVRGVVLRQDGRLLTLLSAGERAVDVEVVDATGAAPGRPLSEPLPEPLFLGTSAIYRVREELGETVIEVLRLHLEE